MSASFIWALSQTAGLWQVASNKHDDFLDKSKVPIAIFDIAKSSLNDCAVLQISWIKDAQNPNCVEWPAFYI